MTPPADNQPPVLTSKRLAATVWSLAIVAVLYSLTRLAGTIVSSPAARNAILAVTAANAPSAQPPDVYLQQVRTAHEWEKRAYYTGADADYRAAVNAFEICSQAHPEDTQVQRSLAILYLHLNKPERAYPHLQAFYSATPNAPGFGQMLANVAGQLGHIDVEIRTLQDVAQRDRTDPWCRVSLGNVLAATGHFADAERYYKQALAIAPHEEWVQIPYAHFLVAQGRTGDANAVIKQVLAVHPKSIAALTLTNQINNKAGFTGESSGSLQAAQELEAKAEKAQTVAAYRAAAAALQACSVAHPDDMQLHRELGYLYLNKLGRPDRAYPHLMAVYSATPHAPGWGQMLARAAGEMGHKQLQIQLLRDVAKANPTDPWCRMDLADALAKAGRLNEAKGVYRATLKIAPHEQWVMLGYAHLLYLSRETREARLVAQMALLEHPHSPAVLSVLGDIDRDNYQLSKAQSEYNEARLTDPNYYAAKNGLQEIQKIRSPDLKSDFFLFDGTDHFFQSGLFNTLTVPVSDHFYAKGTFNAQVFSNNKTTLGTIARFDEGLGVEDRVNSTLSLQGGVSGFELRDHATAGFNVGATWMPTQQFWMYGAFRLNDAVNDSIMTVSQGLKQNLVGVSSGYQFTPDLDLKVNASHAFYSDGNGRNFLHAESAYTICPTAQLRVGGAYEVLDYQRSTPDYPSPHWFQTYGPFVELEPKLTSWLSVHGRLEEAYIAETSQWGPLLTVGPTVHLADGLEFSAEYTYINYPGTSLNYSGNGFRVAFSYRF
jgi:predicted Zn-dependent protease